MPRTDEGRGDPRFEMQVPALPFEHSASARKKGGALERFFNELVVRGRLGEIGEFSAGTFFLPELKTEIGDPRCEMQEPAFQIGDPRFAGRKD